MKEVTRGLELEAMRMRRGLLWFLGEVGVGNEMRQKETIFGTLLDEAMVMNWIRGARKKARLTQE
jgi:hypothetical protein